MVSGGVGDGVGRLRNGSGARGESKRERTSERRGCGVVCEGICEYGGSEIGV